MMELGIVVALAARDTGRGSCHRTAPIEGDEEVKKPNRHIGSSFESWLEEEGILATATAKAVKAVVARQLAREMVARRISKKRLAEMMKTSRVQVDRILDPDKGNVTIETLQRAAAVVGRKLRLELA